MAIIFYDIESESPHKTFAPNPWKTRLALNFKKVAYTTQAVDIEQIRNVRKSNNVNPNRALPDGSEYHTLPMIYDEASKRFIGDSFEIAIYLDENYKTGPPLFRENTIGLTASLNSQIDTLFTKHVSLAGQMPFKPERMQAIAKCLQGDSV